MSLKYRQIQALLAERGSACTYCGGVASGVDHVLPVSRGGTDDPKNLVPACHACNASKNDRTPNEWAGRNPNPRYKSVALKPEAYQTLCRLAGAHNMTLGGALEYAINLHETTAV